MCGKGKVMCTSTIPLRGARAPIGHVAQNLLFLLNLFVQIEQIKNPISVLFLMRKSRRSRNFFVQPAQKFSTMLIDFVQNRENHFCMIAQKLLKKIKDLVHVAISKKNKKNFQKTLDILHGIVYNKYRKLRKEVNKNERI